MDAKDLLNEYSKNLDTIASLEIEKQAVIDRIMTPELKAKIAAIEAAFANSVEDLNQRNQVLIDTVKGEVLSTSKSISGDYHVVKFFKGRVTWDTVHLEGYAAAHPEINLFRNEGKPYTQIVKRTPLSDTIGKAKRDQWHAIDWQGNGD